MSMGYQVGVTALQMVSAVSAGRERRRADSAARGPRAVRDGKRSS
jgi:hypothetical protein